MLLNIFNAYATFMPYPANDLMVHNNCAIKKKMIEVFKT